MWKPCQGKQNRGRPKKRWPEEIRKHRGKMKNWTERAKDHTERFNIEEGFIRSGLKMAANDDVWFIFLYLICALKQSKECSTLPFIYTRNRDSNSGYHCCSPRAMRWWSCSRRLGVRSCRHPWFELQPQKKLCFRSRCSQGWHSRSLNCLYKGSSMHLVKTSIARLKGWTWDVGEQLTHSLTQHESGSWLLLEWMERWIFTNHGAIFTLIH